jgi:hypothetical protein
MRIYKGLSLSFLLCLTSCAMVDRSFLDEMDRESDGVFVPGRDFSTVGGDSGMAFRTKSEIKKRTPKSERQNNLDKESDSIRSELISKEDQLDISEKSKYDHDSKYLPTESDKLYYLSLSEAEREAYIQLKKQDYMQDHGAGRDLAQVRSVHSSEISLGNSKEDVVKKWGPAAQKRIAGNPKYQNEMWIYNEDGSYRKVFFEGGLVSGWALDQ